MWNLGVSKTSDHIQIKMKRPSPHQEPPAPTKVPNQDIKDMNVLFTFKIWILSQNLDHGCIKDQWPYPNQDQDTTPQSGTSSILQSAIWWLKGNECSLQCKNLDHECLKNHWPYSNQDQDAKHQSGTSSILQSTKWWFSGHGCSLQSCNSRSRSADLGPFCLEVEAVKSHCFCFQVIYWPHCSVIM